MGMSNLRRTVKPCSVQMLLVRIIVVEILSPTD